MVGLESSGASSGHCSPQPPIVDDHQLSSMSVSPPSTSSECGSQSGSSSRRASMPDNMKDENYREKRKRNNDSARRSREKRRMNDLAMEQRLLELTKENNLLKSRLNTMETDLPSVTTPKLTVGHEIRPASSVIVAGPSMPTSTVTTASEPSQIPFPPDPVHANLNPYLNFPFSRDQNTDFFYPLDLSQAAMAAAVSSAFKLPQNSANSFFPQHLLAAAAAAAANPAPLLAPVIPGMNGFGLLPPNMGPTSILRPFLPTNPNPSTFSTSKSAFQPFNSQSRPSVVELVPGPPKASSTTLFSERKTSVIQCPPVINGRPETRPSVVQLLQTNGFGNGNHVHFANQLPLESRSALITGQKSTTNCPPIPPPPTSQPTSILGTLLSTRHSPTVPESRTIQQSGLAHDKPENEELKANLSTLAVHLNSASSSSSSNHPGTKSDTESLSPHSTHSTRSGSDERCHLSPNCDNDTKSSESVPDIEKYRDRRRRNNEAAKRCRANRRAAFEYRSKRSQQLEIENGELRQEMLKLNNELEQLKAIIAANNRLLPT